MLHKPKDQSARDFYNIGYGRKYDEYDRISNPYRWLGVGIIVLGILVMCVFALAVDSAKKPGIVFESSDGQQIVIPDVQEYALYNDNTVFTRQKEDTDGELGQLALLGIGFLLLAGGLVFYCAYTSSYIVAKCKKAGWDFIAQQGEPDKED